MATQEVLQLATMPEGPVEMIFKIPRAQAVDNLVTILLYSPGPTSSVWRKDKRKGWGHGPDHGLYVVVDPAESTLRAGDAVTQFSLQSSNEYLKLHIFVDKFLVEVFANDRKSVVTYYDRILSKSSRDVVVKTHSFSRPMRIDSFKMWSLKPCNQGFLQAQLAKPPWETTSRAEVGE